MAKFAFLMRDWKEQFEGEELNTVLTAIDAPVRCYDVDTQADYFLLVVYTPDINLEPGGWLELWNASHDNEIPSSAAPDSCYYEASQQEITDFLKKAKEKEAAEEEKAETEQRELAQKVVSAVEKSYLDAIALTKNLSRYQKEMLWNEAVKIMPDWPVSKVKRLAQLLEINFMVGE